jgi:hypothetical protein
LKRALAFAVALAGLPAAARADADPQLWLEAGGAWNLDKRFELSFDQHLRFDQDVSRLHSVMPELGVSYRLYDKVRVGIGYRFIYERDSAGSLEARHRPHGEGRVRHDVGPFELSYRLRFQAELRPGDDVRHTLRNRVAVQLEETRPWTPTIAAEVFHRLAGDEPVEWRKLRLTAGVARELGDHEIELYYRVEILQLDPADPIPHVVGIGYHVEI